MNMKKAGKHIAYLFIFLFFAFMLFDISGVQADRANPPEYKAPSSFTKRKYPGTLVWPLGSKYKNVSSWVGGRKSPTAGASTDHHGTDIPTGSTMMVPIMAADAGTAYAFKKNDAGRGYYVVIDHGNMFYTMYAHMAGFADCLKNGSAKVAAGEIIGYVGLTGRTTGPHVHFEIAYDWWGSGHVSEYDYTWDKKWGNYGWEIVDGSTSTQKYSYPATQANNDATTLELRDILYPSTYNIKDGGWGIKGGILLSNSKLKTISAKIVGPDGKPVSQMSNGSLDISSKAYGGYSYAIQMLDGQGTDLGNRFSQIKTPGVYKWIISATDNAGKEVTAEMTINAVSSGKTSTSRKSSTANGGETSPAPKPTSLVQAIELLDSAGNNLTNSTQKLINEDIEGSIYNVRAKVYPAGALTKLNWSSSNKSVLRFESCVDNNDESLAQFTIMGPGRTTIAATAQDGSGKSAQFIFEVKATFEDPDFILPYALSTIEQEAFAGIRARRIKVPDGVTTIETKAFADCSELKQICIPKKCTYIASDAFSSVQGLTIFGQAGSYAETYANNYGYSFQVFLTMADKIRQYIITGSPDNYNPDLDLNGDGIINTQDYILARKSGL